MVGSAGATRGPGESGRRGEAGVDLHTRHEPLQQRDGTDWKPFIHSLALSFSPVFDRQSIDHPPSHSPPRSRIAEFNSQDHPPAVQVQSIASLILSFIRESL